MAKEIYQLSDFVGLGSGIPTPDVYELSLEIEASSITIESDGIFHAEGGSYDCLFLSELSSSDKTILDNVIAAHTGQSPLAEGGTNAPTVSSTEAPTADADETSGYTVGSIWVNETTGEPQILKDSTPGAAVWESLVGPKGDTGDTGQQGIQGEQGPQGIPGEAGTAGVFGSEFFTCSREEDYSTSSSKVVLDCTTPTLPAGTYRVGFYLEVKKTSANKIAFFEVEVDGVQISENTNRGGGSSNKWTPFSGFQSNLVFGAGTHNITVGIGTPSSGNYTVSARRVRVELWRVI